MPTISDRRLASLYSSLEAQRRSDPTVKIDDQQVLRLLSEVGDRWFNDSSKVFGQLTKPGVTREQQVAIIKRGMSGDEKKDLAAILDQGTVPLAPAAKNFIEAVIGRSPVTPGPGPITPTPGPVTPGPVTPGPVTPGPVTPGALRVSADGFTGTLKAGDQLEAINISAAPSGRLHMDDTLVVGTADSSGKIKIPLNKLTGDQAVQEGDLIRLRARHADGTAGDFVTVRATGISTSDTRNAVVAVFRIGLADAGSGKIAVTNINDSRQVSEPGAVLQLTNATTGEKTRVTITDTGGFPPGFTVKGKPGDVFSVAATDGSNNTAFAVEVGKLTVPGGAPATGDLIKDPALHKDELNPDGTARFSTKRFNGPLFKSGASPADVQQGQLGDCYFPSAMAALAQNNSDAIQKAIKDNGDGTYTVTFKESDYSSRAFREVPIKVDGDLYVRSWGGPLYGAAAGPDKGERTMELWFPLFEKAYATWKGSYNDVGSGGLSNDVFEAVLGKDGQFQSVSASGNPDAVWATIKRSIDDKQPVSAGTHGEDQSALYTNTGVYADHSYSVLGYKEQGGERYVTLRNPWGESEPAGNGPNDGVFDLKLADFMKLYSSVMYTNK